MRIVLRRVCFITVFVILFYASNSKAELTCPDGWTLYFPEETCVRHFPTRIKSWKDARASCQDKGGDLVTIRNAAKSAFASTLFSARSPYIGLKSFNQKGKILYKWVNDDSEDEKAPSIKIFGNEHFQESCYTLFPLTSEFHEDPCDINEPYLCEQPAFHIAIQTCQEGWKEHDKKCFRAVKGVFKPWAGARDYCLSQSAYLASIPDSATQEFVESMIRLKFRPFWIGLKQYENGQFEWADQGIPLSYKHWGLHQPVSAIDQGCVSLYNWWSEEDCVNGRSPICEKRISQVDLKCDDSWDLNENYEICTKRFFYEVSWGVARNNCIANGGDLLKISDFKLNKYVRNRLGESNSKCFWIGLHALKDILMYGWAGETRLADFNNLDYKSSSPKYGADTCICLSGKGTHWSQKNCSTPASYACQKRPYNTVECPEGYEKYQLGKTCIKLRDDTAEWENARVSCQMEGGDLVTVPDSSTNEFILNLVDRRGGQGYYWIGLHDRRIDNHFQWLDDEKRANFTYWKPGQSQTDTINTRQKCVLISGGSKNYWMGDYCAAKMKFICERPGNVDGVAPRLKRGPDISALCGRGYEPRPNSDYCYRFNSEPLDWVEAQSSCNITGGDLVSFSNAVEMLYMVGKLSESSVNGTNTILWWTGGNDLASDEGWGWTDNQPFNFVNWDFGQPSKNVDDNCIGVNQASGRWETIQCKKHLPSICKKMSINATTPAPISTVTTPLNLPKDKVLSCKPGWKSFRESCYYVHSSSLLYATWADAKKTCMGLSSDLVAISDEKENDFVFSLFDRRAGYAAWIGFSDLKIRQNFEWSDGKTKVTYTNWEKNHPMDRGEDASCVAMMQGLGVWAGMSCTLRLEFVCEMGKTIQDKPTVEPDRDCPKGGEGYLDKCYITRNDKKNYNDAQLTCTFLGGNLATVKDRFIQAFLISDLSTSSYWIGLNNNIIFSSSTSGSGTFPYVWMSGENVGFTNWDRDFTGGEKNNTCVGINNMKKPIGLWHSYSCTHTAMSFICEYPRHGYTSPTAMSKPTSSQSPTASCPNDWDQIDNMCYRIFDDNDPKMRKTWMESRAYCESLVAGGTLASISTADISNKIKGLSNDDWFQSGLWIGLNDRGREGGYRWEDGQPFLYQNWAPGQPDDYRGRQDCVAWKGDSWYDYNCYTTLKYICQAPKGAAVYTTITPPTAVVVTSGDAAGHYQCGNGSWTIFQGDCYMLAGIDSSERKDWFDAGDACRTLGANLVSIADAAENGYVTTLINKMDDITHGSSEYYWIGLNDFAEDGGYKWTDGSPSFFFSWLPGEPNNEFGAERCVQIESDGGWSDVSCHYSQSYVCKKRPGSSSPKYAGTTAPPKGGCPDKFFGMPGTSRCFYVGGREEKDRRSIHNAREACKTVYPKSTLASIHSSFDEDFITTLLSELKTPAWIGLLLKEDRVPRNKEFQWIDNTKKNYVHWGGDEPTSTDYRKCVDLAINNKHAGDWANVGCDDKLAYVCEYRKDVTYPQNKPDTHGCPDGYQRYGESCYKYVSTPFSWSQGEATCVKDGGHLACIQGRYESAFIEVMTNSKQANETWIGLYQNSSETAFSWADGWPVGYTSWDSNQPDLSKKKQCVVHKTGSVWGTRSCSTKSPFVCEINKNAPPPPLPVVPGKCPSDLWTRILDNCYHTETNAPLGWLRASMSCNALGGHLASIHNPTEAKALSLFIGMERVDVWIGLQRLQSNPFEWSDGSEAEYFRWAPGSPYISDSTKYESCVLAQGTNGDWTAVNCVKKFGYLCQTSPIPVTGVSSTSTTTTTTITTTTTPTTTASSKSTVSHSSPKVTLPHPQSTGQNQNTNTNSATSLPSLSFSSSPSSSSPSSPSSSSANQHTSTPTGTLPSTTTVVPQIATLGRRKSQSRGGLGAGIIAGIVIGAILFVAAFFAIAFIMTRIIRKRPSGDNSKNTFENQMFGSDVSSEREVANIYI